ncbi:MAG: hypothetical protein ABR566_16555, partial [Pyrinomonadaceae bacterium]
VLLTVVGSAIGAVLVGFVSDKTMPIIVSVSMIAVTIFTFLKRDAGVAKLEPFPAASGFSSAKSIAYVLTFLLAIYGGLYSGG